MNTAQIQALATLIGVESKPQPIPDMHPISGVNIVAADRGFVWVGDCERSGDCLLIRNTRNIRKWGTTRGIGELVNGPTEETVTDNQGEVVIPWHAVIHITKCKPGSW